jgi:hypothetical protein
VVATHLELLVEVAKRSFNLFANPITSSRGTPSANCWWTGFTPDGTYDPRKGYGYILTNNHGLTVKVWGFVDDFKLHAPTRALILRA